MRGHVRRAAREVGETVGVGCVAGGTGGKHFSSRV